MELKKGGKFGFRKNVVEITDIWDSQSTQTDTIYEITIVGQGDMYYLTANDLFQGHIQYILNKLKKGIWVQFNHDRSVLEISDQESYDYQSIHIGFDGINWVEDDGNDV